MQKKSNLKFMLLVVSLIAVIMCVSSFGLVTWARYRTATGGNIIAQIAKWSFKVNGASEEFADINLADTISFEHVVNNKIAPGTQGSFNLDIDASGSEVSLDYYIDIDVTEKPTNMKFYSDSTYSTSSELQIVNNKIQLEDEILLTDKLMIKTETIYWKWDYRTNEMPTDEACIKHSINKDNLITQYNNALNDTEKQNILLKINDKIDTAEASRDIILQVKVTGVQKNPDGFKLKSVNITSDINKIYKIGDEITFELEFTEEVYADNNKKEITSETAPEVYIEFSDNENLKKATFVGSENNILKYSYLIGNGDKGKIKGLEVFGNIYNKNEKIISSLKTEFNVIIQADYSVPTIDNWSQIGNSSYIANTDTLIGTAGGRSYYKSNNIPAIGIGSYLKGAYFGLISTDPAGTLGYCTYNKSYNAEALQVYTYTYKGIEWYFRTIPYGWADGHGITTCNGINVGKVSSYQEALEKGVQAYFNENT